MEDQPNVTRRKPSRFRPLHSFSLRTLMILVVVVAVPCVWLGERSALLRWQMEADNAAMGRTAKGKRRWYG
jgi:hypothetical protein